MQNHEKTTSRIKGPQSLGKAVARRRDQLEQLKAEDKRRQQEERARREALARELAHLEAQERLARRQQEVNERKRTCYLLGELILSDLINMHPQAIEDHQTLLSRLPLAQRELVTSVVSRIAQDRKPEQEASQDATSAPSMTVDILL